MLDLTIFQPDKSYKITTERLNVIDEQETKISTLQEHIATLKDIRIDIKDILDTSKNNTTNKSKILYATRISKLNLKRY